MNHFPAFRYPKIDGKKFAAQANGMKARPYTVVVRRKDDWWIGWVLEIPGVNSQGKTRAELIKNLRSGLLEAIELNREEALAQAGI